MALVLDRVEGIGEIEFRQRHQTQTVHRAPNLSRVEEGRRIAAHHLGRLMVFSDSGATFWKPPAGKYMKLVLWHLVPVENLQRIVGMGNGAF